MAPAKNGKDGKAGKHTTPARKPGKRGNQFDSLNHQLTQTLQRLADAIERQNALLLAAQAGQTAQAAQAAEAVEVVQPRRIRLRYTPPDVRRHVLRLRSNPRTPPRVSKPVDETICYAPLRRLHSAPSPIRPVGRNLMAAFETARLAPVTRNPFAAATRAEGRYPRHPFHEDEDEDEDD